METNLIYNHVFKCERLNEPKLSYNICKSITKDVQAEMILRAIYEKENIDLEICEVCIALLVNRTNTPIGYYKVSQGGTDATTIDVKMITKAALDTFSGGVILCHNHPSGAIKPSIEDRNLTRAIVEAGKLLDIQVLDHIIVGDNKYYSFKDEGDM